MSDKDIMKALIELKQRGWACSFSDFETTLEWPDGGSWSSELEPFEDAERVLVMGWLVVQLEARGLRREVHWSKDYDDEAGGWYWECQVRVLAGSRRILQRSDLGDSELNGLLECCLALNTLDAQQPPPETGATTAAADSYTAPVDPAVKPVPVEEDREGKHGS